MKNNTAWNIESEYPSLESPEFTADQARITELIGLLRTKIEARLADFDAALRAETNDDSLFQRLVSASQDIYRVLAEVRPLLLNQRTYVECLLSIDSQNRPAQVMQSVVRKLFADLDEVTKPYELFFTKAPEAFVHLYLLTPEGQEEMFRLQRRRLTRDRLLTLQEETLLARLVDNGPAAWGQLYNAISGQMQCEVKGPLGTQRLGLATASGLLRSQNELERQSAWEGIQKGWQEHEESAAAILNALAGWRIEVAKRRSPLRQPDYMFASLHMSVIEEKTLQSMLAAVAAQRPLLQAGLKSVAQTLGKTHMHPSDTLAPAPAHFGGREFSLEEALALIEHAFTAVAPEFGEFVRHMEKQGWIETRVLPSKRQGAYCTGFAKSRTPRVYMTYLGSINDVSTLAHELGHAFHSWVMRDMPPAQTSYPMTLAETASVFAETALADHLSQQDAQAARLIAFDDTQSAAAFLLNIPTRYSFERSFYDQRVKRFVPATELRELTRNAYREWYGDSLQPADELLWASKLHFSLWPTTFYNYPYTFGYLFSLGIYARRAEMGNEFMPFYKRLLRDTGRMTAENLIAKHLGEDIRQPEFWEKSLELVARKVRAFQNMVQAPVPKANSRGLEPNASL